MWHGGLKIKLFPLTLSYGQMDVLVNARVDQELLLILWLYQQVPCGKSVGLELFVAYTGTEMSASVLHHPLHENVFDRGNCILHVQQPQVNWEGLSKSESPEWEAWWMDRHKCYCWFHLHLNMHGTVCSVFMDGQSHGTPRKVAFDRCLWVYGVP